MRKELEDLWFYFFVEIPVKRSESEKEIIDKWSQTENYFHSKLDKEQLKALEEYDSATSQVSRISEKNAFYKGVKFATQLMFEVFYKE